MIADDISAQILKTIQEDNDRTGQKVFHGLLDSVPVNVLPESIFRDYFLPNFLGLTTTPNERWMLEWVSVAGTPMSEVMIIADHTREELFLVPPILNSNSLLMTKSEGDLGDIFTRYDQINKNAPEGGLRFLITALNVKNQELLSSLDNGGVLDRWIAIMERYGVVPIQNQTTESLITPTNTLEDYFDF